MSTFGWSYPPGAASDPFAPYNQIDDPVCEVCGVSDDDCDCPECGVCGLRGANACNELHFSLIDSVPE